MEILAYERKRDYDRIIDCVKKENWQSFYEERKAEYMAALDSSVTLVAYENGEFAGFLRAITDKSFTLFVPEIVIEKKFRGRGFGSALIEKVRRLYPLTRTELISDADAFYGKNGFHKVGTGMRTHDWY